MKRELQFNCLDDNCRTVMIRNGNEHLTDGIRCPRCGGPVNVKPFESRVVTTEVKKPLLTIELDSETSVPRVFYEGKEISNKVRISFDWETRTDAIGGTRYNIEHYVYSHGIPIRKGYGLARGKFALDGD